MGVYPDYRENVIVDAGSPVLCWKANKERFSPSLFPPAVQKAYPEGLPRIGSENSEDALSWNVFRSLQQVGKLHLVTDLIASGTNAQTVYSWGHAVDPGSKRTDPEIQDALNTLEPWGRDGRKQQTETDVILRGKAHIVMVESKLDKPEAKVRAWSRTTKRPLPPDYVQFVPQQFTDSFNYEEDGARFHQLFRNYLLGSLLAEKWGTTFSLLAIVNSRNSNRDGESHEKEFKAFRDLLKLPSNAFLTTWQDLQDRFSPEADLDRLNAWLQAHPCLKSVAAK